MKTPVSASIKHQSGFAAGQAAVPISPAILVDSALHGVCRRRSGWYYYESSSETRHNVSCKLRPEGARSKFRTYVKHILQEP